MAVLKFSQISTTGSNLTSGDFLMAVQGGTTDVLFTPAKVFAFANLVYASNILEQRNSTNGQTLRVYNTFTDSSNYERGVFDWTTIANNLTIGTEALGTGALRNIRISIGPNEAMSISLHGTAFKCNGTEICGFSDTFIDSVNKFGIASNAVIGFSSNTSALGAIDTVLARGAAGIFKFASSQSFTADGTVATVLGSLGPTGANTTVQEWLTIKNASGTTRYIPCF